MGYKFDKTSYTLTTKSRHYITRDNAPYIFENEIKLTITPSSNGTLTWKVDVVKARAQKYTDDSYTTPSGDATNPATYLYLKIGDTVIYNKNYTYGWNTDNTNWTEFPCLAGSSSSDTINTANSESETLAVQLESWVYYTNNPNDTSGYTESASLNITKTYYTNITAGSISITDNKNSTITISGKNAKKGTNNNLAESKLYYKFNNQTTETSINIGTTSESTISKTISIPENATSITARLVSKGQQGDTVTANANNGNSVSVKYRTKPSVANLKLSWESDHKKDNTARLKDDLTWNWSGAKAGTNTPIEGYRIFVYKTTTGNLTSGESKYSYTDGKLVIDSNKSGTSLPLKDSPSSISHTGGDKDDITAGLTPTYNTNYLDITTDKTDGYFTFNPKDAGFENKDYCVFEIGVKYSWGGSTAFSTWVTSEPSSQNCNCYFKNSANVWVKTVDSTDVSAWKEAESIWVKTSSGWKEAEGLWVKTDTNTWSESS